MEILYSIFSFISSPPQSNVNPSVSGISMYINFRILYCWKLPTNFYENLEEPELWVVGEMPIWKICGLFLLKMIWKTNTNIEII